MAQIIGRETMPEFLRVIPSELKFKICLPGTVVIGETAEGPNGEEPAAVLVLTMRRPDEVTVEWLWVEESLQGDGLGESLLMVAFDIAKADDRKKITARIYNSDEDSITDALGATYFMERQFFYERDEELWVLTEEELAAAGVGRIDKELCRPFLSEKPAKTKGENGKLRFVPISEVLERYLKAAEGIGSLYTRYRDMLDRNLSFVCTEGDAIKGALLIARAEDSLCPVCFQADSSAVAGQLLTYAIMELKDALDEKKCFLTVEETTEDIKALMEKLFPKAKPIRITVLSADPDVPEKERRMQEDEEEYWKRVEEEDDNWPRNFVYVGTEFLDGSYVSAEEEMNEQASR